MIYEISSSMYYGSFKTNILYDSYVDTTTLINDNARLFGIFVEREAYS